MCKCCWQEKYHSTALAASGHTQCDATQNTFKGKIWNPCAPLRSVLSMLLFSEVLRRLTSFSFIFFEGLMATAADSAMLRKISLIEDLVPFNISQWSHSPFQVTPFFACSSFWPTSAVWPCNRFDRVSVLLLSGLLARLRCCSSSSPRAHNHRSHAY